MRKGGRSPLRRELGAATAATIVIGNTIGSGIFTTSGYIARDVGSPAWLMALWFAGGLIALTGALAYAELGASIPRAGGEYAYLREAYGPFVAFLSGWTAFSIGFSGAIAAATLAFAGYLGEVLPRLDLSGASGKLVALGVLWPMTAVHACGLGPSGLVQRALTASTVASIAMLLVSASAFGHGSTSNFASSAPAHGSAAVSLIFVLYAYSGWNAAAYLAGEIDNPGRNLPLALIIGTATVTVLYLAMNAVYVYALPIGAMSGVLAVAEKAAVALFGGFAARVIAAILAVAILSSASAMILAGPRVYFAMARDGLFPAAIGAVHGAQATPVAAIIVQSAWASVLIALFGAFEPLVVYTGFAITAFTAAAVGALIVLRVRRPDLPRPFVAPVFPWLPAAYIVVALWVVTYTIFVRPREAVLGVVTTLTGVPLYLLWRMFRADVSR